MSSYIHTEADLDHALADLIQVDPRFGPVLALAGGPRVRPRFAPVPAMAGRPPLRRRPGGFAGLASIVVSQQLSTASAGAIWGRLAAAFDPVETAAVIRARKERLARIGLSGPE